MSLSSSKCEYFYDIWILKKICSCNISFQEKIEKQESRHRDSPDSVNFLARLIMCQSTYFLHLQKFCEGIPANTLVSLQKRKVLNAVNSFFFYDNLIIDNIEHFDDPDQHQ